jgi:putative FmdB family regulatory protein
MPIYEFRCDSCDERFEALVDTGSKSTACRACGSTATRLLSAQAAPMRLVKGGGAKRKQERRNAQLRERTRVSFAAARRRARQSRGGGS